MDGRWIALWSLVATALAVIVGEAAKLAVVPTMGM